MIRAATLDAPVRMITLAKRLGARMIWRNRARKVQTLLRFARTEAGGAVDIARAAAEIRRPDLNRHLVRHVDDEERHAEMFRQRAREVFGDPDGRTPVPDSPGPDLAPAAATATERGSLALTDHGFLPSDNFAALGEVRYLAMLFLAEKDAARDFEIHYAATRVDDPQTAELFKQILRDEEYHCAYTRAQLKAWEKEGRAVEVRRALRQMKWFRFKAQWVQVMQRIGDTIGGVMLRVLYLTLFVPFGLLGRLTRRPAGWVSGKPAAQTLERLKQTA